MLKSLRARNVALLVAVVLVGQLLSLIMIWVLAIKPQAERVGGIMARNVAAISMTMEELPSAARERLIARINRDGAIRILPATAPPPEDRGVPTMVERLFMESFAREMRQQNLVLWRGGRKGQMWARVTLGGVPYWISNERPKGWTPSGAFLASFATAVSLALIGGILLQRRISRPLRQIASAADAMTIAGNSEQLDIKGPTEISVVARSFNRMKERLAAQESERAFMLAGISHDLGTPLAKIRLGLAMAKINDAELATLFDRQLDRIDGMLGQFMAYARGSGEEALQQVDIAALARQTLAALDDQISYEGPAQLMVATRPIAVERALANLLHNAMLHGKPPIVLRLRTDIGAVKINVIDQGEGVNPTQLAALKQPFLRGDSARPNDGGTGLGLAVVERIARDLGGELILENGLKCGFVASLVLPAPS